MNTTLKKDTIVERVRQELPIDMVLPAQEELQTLHQWSCFKKELRNPNDPKPTKIPYQVNGDKARSNDMSTWTTYARVCEFTNAFAGKGFFFNGELYSGVDLDDCVDANGVIADWAMKIINLLDSYAEFSTSGTGVHIIVRGLLPEKTAKKDEAPYIRGRRRGKIEMYSERRFFVYTGKHVAGTPTTINERQEQLLSVLNTYINGPIEEKARQFQKAAPKLPPDYQPAEVPQDDHQLWQIMFREKDNGRKWERLYYGDSGDYTDDESAADFALASKLVFYTGHDASRVKRMMEDSGLARDKWKSHPSYMQMTIGNAMRTVVGDYDPTYGRQEGKIMQDTNEAQEEVTLGKFEQVQVALGLAVENKNTEGVYALTDEISTLDAKDQAFIITAIERSKKSLPGFSKAALNNCLKEAKQNNKQKARHERPYADNGYSQYRAEKGAMWMEQEPTENNPDPDPIQISNFTAEIVTDITTDDGAEEKRSYELETNRGGQVRRFEIPVERFSRCEWVDEHVGAKAIVTAGRLMKEHLANAIKSCSNAQDMLQYAHTGWRKIEGEMVYLHRDGGIRTVRTVSPDEKKYCPNDFFFNTSACRADLERENIPTRTVRTVRTVNTEVRVKLTGSLSKYVFPEEREGMVEAIKASLAFVDITQDTVTMPLYAAIWRAPLGNIDFGVHVAGTTGLGKSELTALPQQHYGASMDARNFPASWDGTKNALELKLFQAKDAIMTVDDFKPKGNRSSQEQLHAKADDIFRAMGNGSARARLNADLNQRVDRVPRCLLISTGEDVPQGRSCQARIVVVTMGESVTKGEAAKLLTLAQKDARSGLYAKAMAGYLEWLAPCIDAIHDEWGTLIGEERFQLSNEGHARGATNTANLVLGMKCFLQYACEMEAITVQDAEMYLSRCKEALTEIAREASSNDQQMKPSEQWKRLLSSAISSGHAHLVTGEGDNPGLGYGWKKSVSTSGDYRTETYSGGGNQIGWIVGEDIYLDPTASYAAVLAEGSRAGDNLAITRVTLQKDLVKDSVLASTSLETSRPRIAVRRSLQGSQREVLHVKKNILFAYVSLSQEPSLLSYRPNEGSEPASEEYLEGRTVTVLEEQLGQSELSYPVDITPTGSVDIKEGDKVRTPKGLGEVHTAPYMCPFAKCMRLSVTINGYLHPFSLSDITLVNQATLITDEDTPEFARR